MDKRLEIVLAAKDATGKVFKSLDTRLTMLQRRIFSFHGTVATLAGGYGLGKLATSFLDVADSFEQLEVKLDALTKGRGKETLEDINQWAIDMPINTKEAVNAFAMMMSYGLDPTIHKMGILVDTASIFGEEAMPRIARALGQMQTLGKLSAEELNQLSESGINARKYLTEAFGMTVEELQKSKISIDRIVQVIMNGLERDFGGAAKKQMESWRGLKATFVSYVTEIERSVMGAGVFTELKTQLGDVNTELKTWLDTNQGLIKQKVPEYIDSTKAALEKIWNIISYDPAILEYGVIGLAIGGKKGAVLMGSLAHMKTWAENLGAALGMASAGILDFKDIATANFKELEELVKKGEALMQGPYVRMKINQPKGPLDEDKSYSPGGKTTAADKTLQQELSWLEQYSRGLTDIEVEAPPLDTRYYDSWKKVYDARKQLKEELTDDIKRLSLDELEYEEWIYQEQVKYLKDTGKATEEILDMMAEKHQLTMDKLAKNTEKTLGQEMRDAFKGWASDISKELTDLAFDAEASFDDIALSWAKMVAQMSIQKGFVEPSFSWMSGIFSNLFGSAQGNVFLDGMVQKFGKGAVFTKPYIFPMAHGAGIIAETGKPEGVLPLTRMPSGNLGVEAMNGGVQIDVHIHNNKAGTDISMEQSTQNGQPRLDIFIDDIMSEKIFSGKTGKALRTGYGLYPTLVAR